MDIFDDIEPPRRCSKVAPGHCLEPIQMKLSRQNTASRPWIEARARWFNMLVGRVGLELDTGEELPFLCHDAQRILDIIHVTGNWRVVIRSHGVIAVPDGEGSYFLFSVKPADGNELGPCTPTQDRSEPVKVKAEPLPLRPKPAKPFVEPERIRASAAGIDTRRFAEDRSPDEVKELLHYAHFIPQSRGFTKTHVDTYWPGHTFPELLYVLRAAGLVTFVSSLGATITKDSGLVRKGNDLKEFRRLLFNDIDDWAVEWPDGSWTRPGT